MKNHQLYNSYHSTIHPSDDDSYSSLPSARSNYTTIIDDGNDDGESKLHPANKFKFTTSTEMFVFKLFRAARLGWVSAAPPATPPDTIAPNVLSVPTVDANENGDTFEHPQQKNMSGRRGKSSLVTYLIGAATVVTLCFFLLPSSSSSLFSESPYAEIFMSALSFTRNEIIAQREADIQQKLLLDGHMIEISDDDDDDDDDDDYDESKEEEEELKTLSLSTSHKKHKKQHDSQKKQTIKLKAPPGCEGTVIIIRHCEKGFIREHCNYLGYERAAFLATQFGDEEEDRWPSPSYIFSLNPGGRQHKKKVNVREIETIEPVADKFNITTELSYTQDQAYLLAHKIIKLIKTGELCGKVALISWKHSEIPHLATKLGCGPKEGCPADYPSTTFDMTVQIKYAYGKLLHSNNKEGKVDRHYQWSIFGSTVNEGFDPLKFSKKYGDYVRGGTEIGARWMLDVDFVEMKKGNTLVKTKQSMGSLIEGGIE